MEKRQTKNQVEQQLKEKMEIFIDGFSTSNDSYKSAAGRALRQNNGEIMAIYRTNRSAIENFKNKHKI